MWLEPNHQRDQRDAANLFRDRARLVEYDSKGDIRHIDYVVYKWDDKGGYAEVSQNGS